MSEVCTACGSSLEELDAFKVGEMLTRNGTMYRWSSKSVGYKENVSGLGEVEVVHNSYDMNTGDGAQLFVWKTRLGFLKVTGHYDSYSDLDWNYDYEFVTPQTKEVTVYV